MMEKESGLAGMTTEEEGGGGLVATTGTCGGRGHCARAQLEGTPGVWLLGLAQ
jgi:hypothetical protein